MLKTASEVTSRPKINVFFFSNVFFNFVQRFVKCNVSLTDGNSSDIRYTGLAADSQDASAGRCYHGISSAFFSSWLRETWLWLYMNYEERSHVLRTQCIISTIVPLVRYLRWAIIFKLAELQCSMTNLSVLGFVGARAAPINFSIVLNVSGHRWSSECRAEVPVFSS